MIWKKWRLIGIEWDRPLFFKNIHQSKWKMFIKKYFWSKSPLWIHWAWAPCWTVLWIYTTWKVDGATPMYWFIMAPYDLPPNLGVASHLLSLWCKCHIRQSAKHKNKETQKNCPTILSILSAPSSHGDVWCEKTLTGCFMAPHFPSIWQPRRRVRVFMVYGERVCFTNLN